MFENLTDEFFIKASILYAHLTSGAMDILLENVPGKIPLNLRKEQLGKQWMNRVMSEATIAGSRTKSGQGEDFLQSGKHEAPQTLAEGQNGNFNVPDPSQLQAILDGLQFLSVLGRRPVSPNQADVQFTMIGGAGGFEVCVLPHENMGIAVGDEGGFDDNVESRNALADPVMLPYDIEYRSSRPNFSQSWSESTSTYAGLEVSNTYGAQPKCKRGQVFNELASANTKIEGYVDDAILSGIDQPDFPPSPDGSEDMVGVEYDLAGYEDGLLDFEEFTEDFDDDDDDSDTSSEVSEGDLPDFRTLPRISESTCVRIVAHYICCAIDDLKSDEEFKQSPDGQRFFNTASTLAENVEQIWQKRWGLESAMKEYEIAMAQLGCRLPAAQRLWRKSLTWPSLCRNILAGLQTFSQEMAQFAWMKRTGIDYPVLRQLLPKGAYTILEHWSLDAVKFMAPMFIHNNDTAVWRQIPTKSNTFFSGAAALDGSWKYEARCLARQEHTLAPTIQPLYRDEERTGVAGFITRKLDQASTNRTLWPTSVGVATLQPYFERKYTFNGLMDIIEAYHEERKGVRTSL